ncbi:hypothetical protein HZH66_000129 [Vespula vulgaris]|uniref:L27 domain-containing protein n=1 Tax=Vespula vulgaris TaxID=7454 RepID=A0A834KR27_VESVU|nr:hypothetical protein HZH66_000129 [Vespula vulgaris]
MVLIFSEAHRALELLEDYHAKLTRPQDKALRLAIERVIRIFKSRLFQALLATASTTQQRWQHNTELENVGSCPRKSGFSMHLATFPTITMGTLSNPSKPLLSKTIALKH